MGFLSIAYLFVGVILFVCALTLLASSGWLKGFIRGSTALSLLFLTFVLGSSSLNLNNYGAYSSHKPLATIRVEKVSTQVFEITIKTPYDKKEQKFNLVGDMFRVGVEKLTIPLSGNTTLFSVDTLETKFYALEQQESRSTSNFSLKKDSYGISFWDLFSGARMNPVVQKKTTPFYAMTQGEVLSLGFSNGDLILKPLSKSPKS
ncbi:MAG: hypothetical protein OXE99_09945 [Cellvibrionales bacterium]|nr:hypothetical protein [Cellvibrionales bacterium]